MNEDGSKEVVEAIHDLTRVILAMNGGFGNKSETIRKLDELGLTTARIGAIIGIPSKDVASVLNHSKKKHEDSHEAK